MRIYKLLFCCCSVRCAVTKMLTMSQSLQMRFVTVLDSTHEDRSTWKRFGESDNRNRGKKMLVRHNIKNTSAGISHEPSAPALVRFSRPHTVFGTMAVCSALCMNIAIVGLNQVYDRKIDMVNKPYLPLASGEFNASTALFIIAFSVLISMLLGESISCHQLHTNCEGIDCANRFLLPCAWKDIPDIMGDAQEGIQTLSVQFGIFGHAIGGSVILLNAAKVDLSSSASLHKFYMLIWKVTLFF
ncbi:unnamed protein product [Bathycoccus prasinos]